MSDAVLQGSLSDNNEEVITPAPDEASAQLYEKLNPVLQLFSDLSERGLHSDVIVKRLLDQIKTAIRPDLFLFFTWDNESREWPLFLQHGLPDHLIKEGKLARAWQSLPTIISHETESLFSDDISKDRRFIGQVVRGINIRTFCGITLRNKEVVYGSLSIGFFEPEALKKTDQTAFLMMSRLLFPFLLPQAAHAAPPINVSPQHEPKPEPKIESKPEPSIGPSLETGPEPISLSLDLSGRIQGCNTPFLDLFGLDADHFKNKLLAKFVTKKAYSAYLSAVKQLKSSEGDISPFDLEISKQGGQKHLLTAKLTLEKREGGPTRVILIAENITQIDTLETDLIYKGAMQGISGHIFSQLQQSAQKIDQEASAHAVKHEFDEEHILKEALKKGFAPFGIEGGCLLRMDSGQKKLQWIAGHGLSEHQQEQIEKQGIGTKEHLLWKVVEKSMPILETAKTQESHLKKRLFGEETLLSFMGVPVETGGHLWGVLCFFSRVALFSEIDLRALTGLSRELGRDIEQIQSFRLLQKRITSLETLNEAGRSITKSLHLEQLLTSVANTMKKMVDASHCYIFLEDGKRHLYYGASASDQQDEATRKFEIKMNENHIIPLTARERHPFVIENASHDPRVGKKWIKAFKSRSLFAVPLINKDRVTGVLILDETRYFRKFTSEEINKAAEMANQVSVGIENAIIHHSVSQHRERLQTLSSAIVNVQEEERRRIAKKLRSESGAALAVVQKDLDWLKEKIESPTSEMKKRLDRAASQTNKTLEALTGLSGELRPAILDESGLIATIKWAVKEFETQTETKVHLQIAATIKRLPARIEILLFRIVQESLTNISTHAKAESAVVSLEKRDPYIHLYVTDDGKGFDVKRYFSSPQMMRKEIGILGMKERVELSGGTFYIDSNPGQGTRISIRIPVVKRNP